MYPNIDIVIPCKNEEKYLADCLNSLISQDYPQDKISIYLVDNGSTDNTLKIAKQFKLTLIEQQKGTLSALRNRGIMEGHSELVVFIDAHCVAKKNWLSTLVEKISSNKDIGGVYGHLEMHYETKALQQSCDWQKEHTPRTEKDFLMPFAPTGNVIFKREALQAVDYFDESLYRSEDVDISWRIMLLGYQLQYARNAIVAHYDPNSWFNYIKKFFYYGIGTCQLKHRYQLTHLKNTMQVNKILNFKAIEGLLIFLMHESGHHCESLKIALGLSKKPSAIQYPKVLPQFRAQFKWDETTEFELSKNHIYWSTNQHDFIIMKIPELQRYELNYTAYVIWKCLINGNNKAETINAFATTFGTDHKTSENDIQEILTFLKDHLILKTTSTFPTMEAIKIETVSNEI